jgi:hypothetical protein
MIRTYADANLLITAFRGNDAGVAAALAVLDDARRVGSIPDIDVL